MEMENDELFSSIKAAVEHASAHNGARIVFTTAVPELRRAAGIMDEARKMWPDLIVGARKKVTHNNTYLFSNGSELEIRIRAKAQQRAEICECCGEPMLQLNSKVKN